MKKNSSEKLHSRKGIFAAALLLGVLFLAPFVGLNGKTASAQGNGSSAGYGRSGAMVKLKNYIAEHEIPNRYLYIGTYLIDSSVITPQYYDLAQKSMRASGQNNQLYKSELAGGAWRDITPGGIDSIRPGGADAASRSGENGEENGGAGGRTDGDGSSGSASGGLSDEEIGESLISCVVGEDGIARDPKTGEMMDVFGNPYDLIDLEELKPLVDQFSLRYNDADRNAVQEQEIYLTQMALGDPEGQYAVIMPRLDQNEVSLKCDARLNTLRSRYYEVLLREEKPGQAAQIMKLMESEDAKRKMEVFRLLAVNGDDSRLSMLSRLISEGSGFEGDMEEFEPEQDYLDAITKSSWNCRSSYDALRTKVVQRRTGVVGGNRFELSERITTLADEQPDATVEEARECADKLFYLENIENGVIRELRPEWEYCRDLVSQAQATLSEMARGGNYEYGGPGVDPDLRDEYMGIFYSLLEQARIELQQLIEAKVLREKSLYDTEKEETENTLRFLAAEMNLNALLLTSAGDTGFFREYIETSLNAYGSWLQATYDRIKSAAGGNDGEAEKEKKALDEAYARAVDDEDYARARELELELAAYNAVSDNSGEAGEIEDFSDYLPGGGNAETFRENLAKLVDGMLSAGDTSLVLQIAKELSDRGDVANLDRILQSVRETGQPEELYEKVKEYRDAAAAAGERPGPQVSDTQSDQTDQSAGTGNDGAGSGGTGNNGAGGSGAGNAGAGNGGAGNAGNGDGSAGGNGSESAGTGNGEADDVAALDAGTLEGEPADADAADGTEDASGEGEGDGSGESGKGKENMRNATGKGQRYVAPSKADHTPSALSDSDIEDAIESALGGPFSGLSQDAKAAVVAALNSYGMNHGDAGCLDYARKLLSTIMGEKNVLVYTKYKHNRIYELVSMGVIDRARSFTGYRWVSIGGKESLAACGEAGKDGIMGGIRFTVEVGERRLVLPDGMKFEMGLVVYTQQDHYLDSTGETNYPYLDEAVTEITLNIRSEYINNTDYAILITEKMQRMVDKIIKALEERIRS